MFGFLRRMELISDGVARAWTSIPKPGYLQPIWDPVFGTKITRITGDPGTAITNIASGIWGSTARHHYSLDQAWNADQSLLYLENNVDPDNVVTGGYPNGHIFLHGRTYVPQFWQQPPQSDIRWHPTDPTKMFYAGSNVFGLWTPSTNATTTIHTFTGYTNLTFGSFKAMYSNDGDTFVFMATNGSSQTVAFSYKISTGTKGADITVQMNNVQISSLGNYIALTNDNEDILVYNTSGTLLSTWAAGSPQVGCPSHADMGIDQGGNEVMVGTGKWFYSGRLVSRRFSDGTDTLLTPSSPNNYATHTSTRCTSKLGWAVTTYADNGSSYPLYNNAIIAAKLDGTKTLQICHCHVTNPSSSYYAYAYASVSQTGDRIIFGSNWDDPNGNTRPVQSYIADISEFTGMN